MEQLAASQSRLGLGFFIFGILEFYRMVDKIGYMGSSCVERIRASLQYHVGVLRRGQER